METIIPLENELYSDYINRILNSRENVKDKDNYQELHHIMPKCLGGSNDKNNLIYLYAQEHYYAHKLLAKENPSNQNLQYAFWNMCQCSQNGNRKYNIAPEEYEAARINFSKLMKNNQYAKGNKFSEESLKRISEAHKGLFDEEKNPMYGKHCSDSCKEKIRNKLSGENNPAARKVKCIETQEIFNTIKQAIDWCCIGHSDIAAYIRGKQKSAGKHPITGEKLHWVYIE